LFPLQDTAFKTTSWKQIQDTESAVPSSWISSFQNYEKAIFVAYKSLHLGYFAITEQMEQDKVLKLCSNNKAPIVFYCCCFVFGKGRYRLEFLTNVNKDDFYMCLLLEYECFMTLQIANICMKNEKSIQIDELVAYYKISTPKMPVQFPLNCIKTNLPVRWQFHLPLTLPT
jgi:hypothetical protein